VDTLGLLPATLKLLGEQIWYDVRGYKGYRTGLWWGDCHCRLCRSEVRLTCGYTLAEICKDT
jgi:hypothetical protein